MSEASQSEHNQEKSSLVSFLESAADPDANEDGTTHSAELYFYGIPDVRLEELCYFPCDGKMHEDISYILIGVVGDRRSKNFLTSELRITTDPRRQVPKSYIGIVTAREAKNYFFGDHIDFEIGLDRERLLSFVNNIRHLDGRHFYDLDYYLEAEKFMQKYYDKRFLIENGKLPVEIVLNCYFTQGSLRDSFFVRKLSLRGAADRSNFIRERGD